MSRAYYGTRISDNKVLTPEGYLICKNVPVARTGWQDYRGREIGLDTDDIVQVYRSPEEVFNPATVASFEGKTVTDTHPSEWVQPSNEGAYHKGHTQHVRRGPGDESDLLLADLFIKDANLINKVQNGLREVSCGYDCIYEPIGNDRYEQKQIRGNHVAVVHSGRAGDRVAIRDSAEHIEDMKSNPKEKRRNPMNWKTIFGLGLKEFARDAEPEAVANAFEAAKEGEKRMEKRNEDADFPPKAPEKPEAPQGGGNGAPMMAMLERILAVLEQLVQSDKAVHESLPKPPAPEDALSELETELAGETGHAEPDGDEPKEEEAMDAGVIEPVETLPEEDLPKNPIPGADRKAVLDALRVMKPIIAQIKDPGERKKAVDAAVSAFRKIAPAKTQPGASYGKLHLASVARSPLAAMDQRGNEDPAEIGRKLKDKYHRKAVAK